MRRRRYVFDEKKVQEFRRQGRGQPLDSNYRPWLTVNDLSSEGRCHRPHSDKTGRVHELLSDGEWKCFLGLEANWDAIFEQYPLDRLLAYKVARALGVTPPMTLSGTPYPLTADFLYLHIAPGIREYRAISFKYREEDLTDRDMELHEICRLCLEKQGVPFELRTESIFHSHFEQAWDSIRACYDLTGLVGFDPASQETIGRHVLGFVRSRSSITFLEASHDIGSRLHRDPHDIFLFAKHLIARNLLRIDLFAERDIALTPACEVEISPLLVWP